MKRTNLIILLLLLFLPATLAAQEKDDPIINHQLWLSYYHYFYFKPKWQYYGDAGYRVLLEDGSWNAIYIRPSVRYHPRSWIEAHGGIGLFQNFNRDTVNTLEIRPWQGVKLNWPSFPGIWFGHYFRLEERINLHQDRWTVEFSLRFRYQLSMKVVVARLKESSFIFIPAFGELFADVGDEISEQFSNRSRWGLGLGYKHKLIWTFEFHTVFQSSITGNELNTNDLLWQLKVRKYIFGKDYQQKEMPDYN